MTEGISSGATASADARSPDDQFVASADQVSCDLQGEAAILHFGSGRYYSLNPVGSRVWALLQQPATLAQLCETVVQEYDVEPPQCIEDLRQLLAELTAHGLIQRLPHAAA